MKIETQRWKCWSIGRTDRRTNLAKQKLSTGYGSSDEMDERTDGQIQ